MNEHLSIEKPDVVAHHFIGGVYAKQMNLQQGQTAVSHQHHYDHMSVLVSGRALVRCGDEAREYAAPAVIEIKRHVNHEIHALETLVWLCIHPVPEDMQDPEHVDEVLIR